MGFRRAIGRRIEANARGGVIGRKIELISEDSQLKPEVAVSKAQKYLLEGNVDIILAAGSNIVKPLQDLAKQYNVLLIMAAHADDETGKNFTYNAIRPTWNTSMIARALIAYAAKQTPIQEVLPRQSGLRLRPRFGAALRKEIARQIPNAQIVGEDYHPSHVQGPFLNRHEDKELRGRCDPLK